MNVALRALLTRHRHTEDLLTEPRDPAWRPPDWTTTIFGAARRAAWRSASPPTDNDPYHVRLQAAP